MVLVQQIVHGATQVLQFGEGFAQVAKISQLFAHHQQHAVSCEFIQTLGVLEVLHPTLTYVVVILADRVLLGIQLQAAQLGGKVAVQGELA